MWPLGHVAVAYLCYTLSTRYRWEKSPETLPVFAVVFGSLFPDLVDKPLAWYLGVIPTGRTLAHSLVVLVPLCLVIFVLARRAQRGEYAIAFAIGAISHVLVDALPAIWGATSPAFLLWPLIEVETYPGGAPSVLGLLFASFRDPYFYTEFILAGIAFVAWRRDGYPGLDRARSVASLGREVTDR